MRKTQTATGGWTEYTSQSCGLSSLCTLALLNAGVDTDDPTVAAALRYLRLFTPQETYSVSLQTLVFCEVGARQDDAAIERNIRLLQSTQIPDGAGNPGGWTYSGLSGKGDPSNTQFAALALGAAVDRGFGIAPEVMPAMVRYWLDRQLPSGGWAYGRGGSMSGSMTCAGIGSLIIARNASSQNGREPIERLDCCNQSDAGEAIDRAMDELATRFTLQGNPGGKSFGYFYYLYAVERIGRLTGRRLIADRDWYREGAEQLVADQDPLQGRWVSKDGPESNPDIATSFALLFLAKGKRQVVIGQLTDASLGQEPAGRSAGSADAAALSGLVGQIQRDWRRDLTWQQVEAPAAAVEDLLRTPVLLVAGGERFDFGDDLTERLAAYVDAGGTLLFDNRGADGCGDAAGFEQSVEAFCRQAFPAATLDPLPPSHPIWFAQRPVDPDAIDPPRWPRGLSACCRTAVFYSPVSLACRWRLAAAIANRVPIGDPVRRDVIASVSIGENLIAYATGRQLRDKLDDVAVVAGQSAPPPTRGSVPLAVAAIGAGETLVPRAPDRAAGLIADRMPVPLTAIANPISLRDASLADVGVLLLQGRESFELSGEAAAALKTYLERGGLLIISPICGSEAFLQSAVAAVAALTDQVFEPMAADHPAWTASYGGFDVTSVRLRLPPGPAGGRVQVRQAHPVFDSMRIDGYETIFASRYDLACALESQNSIQCPGYDTADAAAILGNLIVYGLGQ